MVGSVLVYGAGSAGLLAALTLRRRLPQLPVTVLRVKELDFPELGEGTTTSFGYHLHNYCAFDVKRFYKAVRPMWKLGTRFEWGPRPYFDCVFGFELDSKYNLLPRGTGYYVDDTEPFVTTGLQSRLMHENKVWARQANNAPRLHADEFAYHVDMDRLVSYYEALAREGGIALVDGSVTHVVQDESGVTGLGLASGRTLTADLYVDATGPSSRLLGQALAEPFLSYGDALFCDRALLGGWQRSDEPIHPYTSIETMNAGWCWQIEHEDALRRGYAYATSYLSDAEAEVEFRAKNPKVQATQLVGLRPGRHERFWVKNVVGVGDAASFIEPLEATGPAALCQQCQALADTLADCDLEPNPATMYNCNRLLVRAADAVRDFLAVHYRFNRRLDTPFWRACQEKVDLHWANRMVEVFQENGPTVLWRRCLFDETDVHEFGMEGYLAMLVGQAVPYRSNYTPSTQDRHNWASIQEAIRHKVATAFTVPQALALVRSERWAWPENLYNKPLAARP